MNLRDQFGLQGNIVVGPGQYLCNPANKNFEGSPPRPNAHLACYEISSATLG